MDDSKNFLIGIVTSIIATVLVTIGYTWLRKKKIRKRRLKLNYLEKLKLGKKFIEQGLTKFHFSRDDYGRTLASFLESAKNDITIVSISLKNTNDEGRLTELFRRKLATNQHFTITISLINPKNKPLINFVADSLDITAEKLSSEIVEMLDELLICYNRLNEEEQSRFTILIHDCFPMGSVIMLDAEPSGGIIQVETKLYKSPRTASFGFQITKKGPFYEHNFGAWHRVIQDSKPYKKRRIIRRQTIVDNNIVN